MPSYRVGGARGGEEGALCAVLCVLVALVPKQDLMEREQARPVLLSRVSHLS